MNWKLILQLTLFGLVMGPATVYIIPSNIEALIWLPIFILCAYLIAKHCVALYFLNGFMVGVINAVWITAAHLILFDTYLLRHGSEAVLYHYEAIPMPPKAAMIVLGIFSGVASGLILGLFAFIASKIVKRKPTAI